MTKYDERFKLEVVQRYLSGDKGCKALAREFGVSSTQVEQWVASYKRHGADGLRRKGHVKYSAQFKLEALERMQRENLSRTHMQALLDIRDAGAIARWERQYHEGGFAALLPRPKGRRLKWSSNFGHCSGIGCERFETRWGQSLRSRVKATMVVKID
ncbi:helix-turn-helix domain-containing protein [Burkholderia pseudomallei]|uniref:helix-turn-helix domain-containing protein n=1 Tax=Burkholderia pseudomallei TaxID=28450 RepID=UPI0005365922|nr:helix-turn-helix domain-containing protein [Burkholderia pseudomallei]KGX36785.1 transposase family protein [Burkholderia pseudomallei MSHR3335]